MARWSFPLSGFNRWQQLAIIGGALSSIIVICSLTLPVVIDFALHDRDKEIADLKTMVSNQSSDIRELRTLLQTSVNATQKRFEQNEAHTGDLREAVAAIRAELRVRFHPSDPIALRTDGAFRTLSRSGSASRPQLPRVPDPVLVQPGETDEEALQRLAAKTDQSLEDSRKSVPRGKPLEKVRLF